MTGLVLQNVTIRPAQGGTPLFPPLSLTVAPGVIATLMGPSGIGKSTLLDFIGGHLTPDFRGEGAVILNGKDLGTTAAERRQIGILFQDALLFPHLSVGANLAFGLTPAVRGRAARRAAVAEALDQAGLPGFENRDPATLSGGQRARVALMRALLARPEALLLDEPFAKLDPALRAEMRSFVYGHLRARNIPAILTTHDADDAAEAAGPVIRL